MFFLLFFLFFHFYFYYFLIFFNIGDLRVCLLLSSIIKNIDNSFKKFLRNNFVLNIVSQNSRHSSLFAMTVKLLSYLTYFKFTLPYRVQILATRPKDLVWESLRSFIVKKKNNVHKLFGNLLIAYVIYFRI